MRYMMFIKHPEDFSLDNVPQSMFGAMGEFVQAGFKSGVLKDTAGLEPTAKGTRFKLSKGKISQVDGPFTESKEIVGGYAIVETKTHEEALKLAHEFMELHRIHWPAFEGECEVRPMQADSQ